MGQPKFKPVKTCIFCPNKADSREHAWSDWLLNRFGKGNIVIAGKIQGMDYYDPNQKQILVRCVCWKCNEGWMQQLEEAVIPIIEPLIFFGKQTRLDVLQQWTITQWAMKTAMVFEYCVRHRDPFYTRQECRALCDPITPTPPSFSYVWIGDHADDLRIYTKGNDMSSRSGEDFKSYVTTFAFGRLVIQVITIRSDSNTDPYAFIDCNQRLWSDALLRIWPTNDVVSWPPSVWMDQGNLDFLHMRCGGEQELITPPF